MQNLMANIPNYLRLKNSLFFFLAISFFALKAQDTTSLQLIKLENTTKLSVDRYQNIYLVNGKQDVLKYKEPKQIYSSKKRTEITHIEAVNSLKIFLFN